jgi:hypothetical protein
MEMSDFDRENFAVELTDKCENRAQWLSVMRFGLETLMKEPKLLMELVVRRASRELAESQSVTKVVADFAADLLSELGLKFVV